MLLKRLCFALLLGSSLSVAAQYQVTSSTAVPYKINPDASFFSYGNEWNNFLLFKRTENKENIYSLVMTDNDDRIVLTNDLRVATTVEDNHFLIAGVALAGRNLTVFVESRNAKTGRNVLAMQAADNKGGLTSEGMLVGYFDSKEPDNAGAWHITSTPDQMHIALIAQLPHEPGKADRFMYYFMNENLTITHKGEFAVTAADQQAVNVDQFLASDQGDLYILSGKKNSFPVAYKGNIRSGEATVTPVVAGPSLAAAEWMGAIRPGGGLNIIGYLRDKNANTIEHHTGSWNFDFSHPETLKTTAFEQPVPPSKLKNILFNGAAYFAVSQGKSNFQVLAFDTLGQQQKDHIIPFSKDQNPKTGMASGLLQGKLCLIYNDPAAIAVSITNDGEITKQTIKRQDNGILRPGYFSAVTDRIVMLSEQQSTIKAVTIH